MPMEMDVPDLLNLAVNFLSFCTVAVLKNILVVGQGIGLSKVSGRNEVSPSPKNKPEVKIGRPSGFAAPTEQRVLTERPRGSYYHLFNEDDPVCYSISDLDDMSESIAAELEAISPDIEDLDDSVFEESPEDEDCLSDEYYLDHRKSPDVKGLDGRLPAPGCSSEICDEEFFPFWKPTDTPRHQARTTQSAQYLVGSII